VSPQRCLGRRGDVADHAEHAGEGGLERGAVGNGDGILAVERVHERLRGLRGERLDDVLIAEATVVGVVRREHVVQENAAREGGHGGAAGGVRPRGGGKRVAHRAVVRVDLDRDGVAVRVVGDALGHAGGGGLHRAQPAHRGEHARAGVESAAEGAGVTLRRHAEHADDGLDQVPVDPEEDARGAFTSGVAPPPAPDEADVRIEQARLAHGDDGSQREGGGGESARRCERAVVGQRRPPRRAPNYSLAAGRL
jgi:hypothetical protein